ncbi:nuclear transport factor 2 family protein [Agromyces atrinae]|uniref:YybH family protein n=1 Tax=Agromyces atrinae TaxID=592376 RepID=UPI001F56B969|nr:SgcJ/EcaC family oxidoreductase [Agromyces atrinae]MCI2959221.1 nuclear transport factor 2 family protein [Agromyces atrinae]
MTHESEVVEAITDSYIEAVAAQDAEALLALYAPDVRVFDLWTEWSFEGVDAWTRQITAWFDSIDGGAVRASFDDLTIRGTTSSGVVVADGYVAYASTDADGTPRSMLNRLTWVIEKRDDAWLITHEHTSAPVDESHIVILSR